MKRRTFLSSCTVAAVGSGLLGARPAPAVLPEGKPFAHAKLRMSAPLDWFPATAPKTTRGRCGHGAASLRVALPVGTRTPCAPRRIPWACN
jgi:hypothetical protein